MTIAALPDPALAPSRKADIDSWTGVLSEVIELARGISSTEFVPRGLQSVEKTTAAILYGRELGLPPMTALSSVVLVNGRPSLYAKTQRALILAAGHELRIRENTPEKATIWGRRREDAGDDDAWVKVTFSRADAERAGLWGSSDPWKKYPADMLLNRATSRISTAMFADVVAGLETAEAILDEDIPAPATVTVPAPATARARRATMAVSPAASSPALSPAESGRESSAAAVEEEGVTKPAITPRARPRKTEGMSRGKQQVMLMHFKRLGVEDRGLRLKTISAIVDRPIGSALDLTDAEADQVIALMASSADAGAFARRIAELKDARITVEDPAEAQQQNQ